MTREHNWADNYILAERFHVVAADLRGYGDSSAPPEEPDSSNYSFRAIAQDEVEVMQAAEVAKILVEADELDRVPADPDPETERPPHSRSSEAACLATSTAWRWARISTWVENSMFRVQPARKPNSTKGSWKRSADVLRSPQSGRLATLTPSTVVGCSQILIADLLGRLREFAYGGRITANSDIYKG